MLEDKLKNLIIEKYGSVRQFSFKIDIPYTTVDSILKRGIDNSNVGNVIKICHALDLSLDESIEAEDLIFKNDIKLENAFDTDINQFATKNGIQVVIDKDSPLTANDVVEVNKKLMEVMQEQEKNKE